MYDLLDAGITFTCCDHSTCDVLGQPVIMIQPSIETSENDKGVFIPGSSRLWPIQYTLVVTLWDTVHHQQVRLPRELHKCFEAATTT